MSVAEIARVSGESRQTLYRYLKTDGAGATTPPVGRGRKVPQSRRVSHPRTCSVSARCRGSGAAPFAWHVLAADERSRSGCGANPRLEAVEDQVEPERELVAVVVAGLEDVLDGELGEVGVLVRGHLRHHHFRYLRCLLFRIAHGQGRLL